MVPEYRGPCVQVASYIRSFLLFCATRYGNTKLGAPCETPSPTPIPTPVPTAAIAPFYPRIALDFPEYKVGNLIWKHHLAVAACETRHSALLIVSTKNAFFFCILRAGASLYNAVSIRNPPRGGVSVCNLLLVPSFLRSWATGLKSQTSCARMSAFILPTKTICRRASSG